MSNTNEPIIIIKYLSYSEAQRRAVKKYNEKNREAISIRNREKAKIKELDPEYVKQRNERHRAMYHLKKLSMPISEKKRGRPFMDIYKKAFKLVLTELLKKHDMVIVKLK